MPKNWLNLLVISANFCSYNFLVEIRPQQAESLP